MATDKPEDVDATQPWAGCITGCLLAGGIGLAGVGTALIYLTNADPPLGWLPLGIASVIIGIASLVIGALRVIREALHG